MKSIQSDSFIFIDECQVSRNKTIPYRVRFEFDSSNLPIIFQAQKNNCSLHLSTKNLTNLRYYALLAYSKERSPLVFITNYTRDRETTAIVKSTISAKGKISQQIRRDAIRNTQLFRRIIGSHHWLIFQILTQLSLKSSKILQWLFLAITLLTFVLTLLLIFCFLPLSNLLKIIVSIFSWTLLLAIAIFVTKYKLATWILHQLLEGFLSTQFPTRKLGIQLLNLVIKSLD